MILDDLFRVSDGPHFPDHRDLDLAWVLHVAFDLLGYLKAQLPGTFISCFFSIYNHTQFTAGLDGEALVNSVEAEAYLFQFL